MSEIVPQNSIDPVFRDPPLAPHYGLAQARWMSRKHPKHFPTPERALHWLKRVQMPKSLRWAFIQNCKAGSTSVKSFLFECEFNSKLTARSTSPNESERHEIAHELPMAALTRRLNEIPKPFVAISSALRLGICRDPVARSVSSFFFLCRSQELSTKLLQTERIRLNAISNFDFEKDMYTTKGFEKFLDYLEHEIHFEGYEALNPHLGRQVDNLKPEFSKIQLLGRVENISEFYSSIAERLEIKLNDSFLTPHLNRTDRTKTETGLKTKDAKSRISKIFDADFETFNY